MVIILQTVDTFAIFTPTEDAMKQMAATTPICVNCLLSKNNKNKPLLSNCKRSTSYMWKSNYLYKKDWHMCGCHPRQTLTISSTSGVLPGICCHKLNAMQLVEGLVYSVH